MIPLAPALVVAAANAFVSRGKPLEPTGQPWCAAFVHHVGYWALFDHAAGRSSWPLPAGATCAQLFAFAKQREILFDTPMPGDVFLISSGKPDDYVHTGIVVGVEPGFPCIVVEAKDPTSANGRITRRRARRFKPNDRFIRWVDLDRRARAA